MAQLMSVRLSKGDSPNLGFRLQGGKDFGTPLVIQKVNGGSPAEKAGLIAGDAVIKINNTDVFNLRHKDAQEVIVRSGPAFEVTVQRGGSTWKPSVVPQGNFPSHQGITSNVSPVTKTSLAAQNQSNIGAIGTGHNLAAKPFAPQQNGNINGGPKLVNKQYNTPVGLYSEESIAETLSAQTEVLATGALGVNFKKNEKNFDISKSAVLSVLQEAEKEPSRDYETGRYHHSPRSPNSSYYSPARSPISGRPFSPEYQHHHHRPNYNGSFSDSRIAPTVQLPSSAAAAVEQRHRGGISSQYPGDQGGLTICTDCERVIVGVFVRIKDKNLHVECFKCSTCGCSLKNVGYYNINQKLYCDIHAKLAAKNNPPAPNLVPVTLPPANRAPAGTISAALGSHSHPLSSSPAAPLSPHLSNTSAAPYQPGSELPPSPNVLITQTTTNELKEQTNNASEVLELRRLEESILAASKRSDANEIKAPVNITSYLTHDNNVTAPVTYIPMPMPMPSADNNKQTGSNFGGPRPFASVISPLSPALNNYSQPSLPQANFPRNPAPVAPSVISPPIAATPERGRLVENVVWPPISETESEVVPTASPLYFPPPSQVHVQHILKVTDHDVTEVYQPWGNPRVPEPADKTDEDYNELEEYNALMSNSDPKMSLCSAEVLGITGRRSAVECAESLSTALETAMLIDNVMKNRPKTPPPVDADIKVSEPHQKAKAETTAKSVCPCKNSCCNETCDSCPMRPPSELKRPADYQPKEAVKSPPKSPSKVINCVPQKYESPMVQALKVASDTPYGQQQDFSQIPSKSSSTGFATALTIAPSEPFSVVPTVFTNREPIPLPEETEPYFPPQHHYVSEPKPAAKVQQDIPEKPDSPFVDALKVAPDRPFTPQGGSATPTVRKKKPQPDPLLKDLPKSHEILTMRSALTVASDRTYSPLTIDLMQTCKEQTVCQQRKHVEEQRKTPVKQTVLQPFVPIMSDCFLPVNDSHENPPTNFPPITDELRQTAQYKADYSEIKSEISSQIYEQTQMAEYSEEQIQQQQAFLAKQEAVCQMQSSTGRIERQSEQTVYKKPLNLSQSLHKPDYLPQYQASLEYDEVIELPHHKNINNLLQPKSRVVPDQRPLNTLRPENPYPARTPPPPQVERRPVNTVQQGHHVPSTHIFQPVHEEERPNSESFSTRNPRPITPSMINKPAAAIPYYQTNLVASQCLAPESQVFDPKSPATSRSPSPCPGGARSSSPFPRASPRAKSPAPGPPPNPLKKEQVPAPPHHHVTFDQNSQLRERAKDNLSSFLPQYKERMERTPIPQINLHQDSSSLVESSQSERTVGNVSISERQQHEERQRREAASRHNVVQQGNVTKSIRERALLEEQQRRNQSEVNTVERSADNSVQIQRKKVVTEEFEHVHKEKNIEIQTSGSSDQYFKTYPFQNVNVPKTEEHGISGLHVTNPHAITSPFLGNAPSKAHVVTQPISNPVVVVKPAATVPNKQAPIAVKPASASVPSQFRPVVPPIVPPKSVAGTSHQNVKSSCGANLPDLGAGAGGAGGKQAGAVPFSPKRGRAHDSDYRHYTDEEIIHTVDVIVPINNQINVTIPLTKSSSGYSIDQRDYATDNTEPFSNRDITITRSYTTSPPPPPLEPRIEYLETEFTNLNLDHHKSPNNFNPSETISISITPHLNRKTASPNSDLRDSPKSHSRSEDVTSESISIHSSSPKSNYNSDSEGFVGGRQILKNARNQQTNSYSRPVTPLSNLLKSFEKGSSEKPKRFIVNNAQGEDKYCNVCNKEITGGPFISALGKIWCPDHFVCATPSCKRPLQDLGFVEEQGKLYCEYCFEQYLAPNCSKCNGKIKADCLRAIGKHFHPECFKCTYCSKMFGNNPFFLEDGLPYCQDDWNELFTTKCFACGFPVEAGDRWVEALNNNYHTQCFNCSMCKKNLEGQSFFAKGGRPFCKNHAR